MNPEEKRVLEWMATSKHRALIVSILNFAVRVVELTFQMDTITAGGGINTFLDQPLEYLISFFFLRIFPAVMGLLLLFAVIGNHTRGCLYWCGTELLVIMAYILFHVTSSTDNSEGIRWNSNLMFYGYCSLRTVSILVIYDFVGQLVYTEEQAKEIAKRLIRNHFWHQLSNHHALKTNDLNAEKESQLEPESSKGKIKKEEED